jgi:hypothetical protein
MTRFQPDPNHAYSKYQAFVCCYSGSAIRRTVSGLAFVANEPREHAARNDHVRNCFLHANLSGRLCVTAAVVRES